jgi:transcriptional regulator with XRE-family HTH domain
MRYHWGMALTKEVAGELIRDIRRRSGLRQAELARRAGLPRSVVSAYEHGHRQPGVDALARLAAAAGMELRLGSAAPVDPVRAGRILSQVLDLAESLPARRRGALEYPSLRRLAG